MLSQFIIFPVSSNIFVPNGKLVYFPAAQEFSVRRQFFHKPYPLHILHIYKQTAGYIVKRAYWQAGEHCFLNCEMLAQEV